MTKIKDPLTGQIKEKAVTELSPPPEMTASAYSANVRERKEAMRAAKQKVPVGGAPPIPPGKLAPIRDAALAASGAMPKPFFADAPKPPTAPQAFSPPPSPPAGPPPIPGVGAGFAVNQVVSGSKKLMNLAEAKREAESLAAPEPMTPSPRQSGLSRETVDLLRKQDQQMKSPPPVEQQQEVEESSPSTPSMKQELDAAESTIADRKEDLFSTFNFREVDRIQQLMVNDVRRKDIENQLKPLDITDLITKRYIQQIVPSVNGKLTYTLKTLSQSELLFCSQYTWEKTGGFSPEYSQFFLETCRLVCGVLAINGSELPDHRDHPGRSDEAITNDKFQNKMKILLSMPAVLMADIGVQWSWFMERVAKLFSVDTVKNG